MHDADQHPMPRRHIARENIAVSSVEHGLQAVPRGPV